jgi:murein DD-endopeptidase MepM/ murein hydrolase activator NlpD
MRLRPILPALAVALAVAAALGPPAEAASGGGGGTGVTTGAPAPASGDGGGAVYGQAAPTPKRKHRSRSATQPTEHRFPIAGPFTWGGPDARFGVKRKGHRHQGQDLPAAAGTPVVAPHAGTVESIGYQARGAGHYLVLDGDGEDYDYVFMHLRTGSIGVSQGQRVAIGQQLGAVGSTGESSGPHLHFEIWVGGWYTGGHPIDPLPLLQAWGAVSPASG